MPSSPLLGGQPKRTQAFEAPARPSNGGGDAVEASGLTKVFGDFTAADHISFTIKRGEIFGLLGPNGAGKSTTFKMMCGLLRPTAGTARVDGYDLYRAPAVARGPPRLHGAEVLALWRSERAEQSRSFSAAFTASPARKSAMPSTA